MKNIAVVGYPRSGNTWVSRLLGDILDSPVGGAHSAKPLCTEGQERKGPYRIQQLHLKPNYRRDVAMPAWEISVPEYQGDPVLVLVFRDPRDVVVSAMNYWRMRGIDKALDSAVNGHHPLGVHGPWHVWVTDWLKCPLPYAQIRYEDLYASPEAECRRLLEDITKLVGGFEYDEGRITGAIARQEFHSKREQIHQDGNDRPYGKTIQLHHLHKGEPGAWESNFNVVQEETAREHFSAAAKRLGYTL